MMEAAAASFDKKEYEQARLKLARDPGRAPAA